MTREELRALSDLVQSGGPPKYHEAAREKGKLFARRRIELLFDAGTFVEDGRYVAAAEEGLPTDGVITGLGEIEGRPVAVMANDSTVKAGSWGKRTVEKILRIQERAGHLGVPLIYMVDSAGARITDQVEMFPGRRGAGRIFYNQVNLSGVVPQICLLFGPSAAGGAYIPAFTDITVMVEGNASMYLGSPRMAEMVIGERVTLEEMGGARMHATVSGCGDVLVKTEEEAIALARRYLGYFPLATQGTSPVRASLPPGSDRKIGDIVPEDPAAPFDMRDLILALVDDGSALELKELFAPEILTFLARIDGNPIGIVANQPRVKGGVLFVDSSDKAARFVTLMDAFNLPILFLADVPGFMIGSAVERQGIIRHGAKLISAVSEARCPKISVIVRKAYGAGLYAMAGPAFGSEAVLALPQAEIAVMGPEAAVNAVYANRIEAIPDGAERKAFIAEKRKAYQEDIDIVRLASEGIVDAIVDPDDLRVELVRRLAVARGRRAPGPRRYRGVPPV